MMDRPASVELAEAPACSRGAFRRGGAWSISAVLALLMITAAARGTSPALSQISPRGGQRGTELETHFTGARLGDAQEILFTKSGVEVTSMTMVNDNDLKVMLKIAPDAPLGTRAAYVRTLTGLSNVWMFTVGELKEVAEAEPNNDLAKAQKVDLNSTVNGVVENEDVDYYSFEAQAGQRVNFEVEGLRLAGSPLDPALTLFGPNGREITAVDDTALLGQDAALGFKVEEAGTYTIMVREASYGGGGNFNYRLHMGTFPRPMGVYPPGGRPGEVRPVKWLGDPAMGDDTTTMPLQAGTTGLYPNSEGLVPPSEVPIRVADLENYLEVEPNDLHTSATAGAVPGAMSGIIDKPGDVDYFSFEAKKDQVFDFNCYARRIRSPLDSVLYITNGDGGVIAGDDDAVKPDSYMRWTCPGDGTYKLYVVDHLKRGGPNFTYRVEATAVKPGLGIVGYIPGRLDLQSMSVPVGGRIAAMLSVRRRDMGGDINLEALNLPPGVTAEIPPCPNGVGDIPILFTADPATTASGRLVDIVGRLADPNNPVEGHIDQTVEMVRIINNIPIMIHNQKEMPLAVTEKVPFSIEIIEPKVPVVRNGVMNLVVKATREAGYEQPIDIRMLWNPPGISSSTARIEAGMTTQTLQVTANGGAAVGDWKIAVIGGAAFGNAGYEVSSQLAKLSVSEPWIAMSYTKVRTDQGTPVEMAATITPAHPFEGEAELQLVNLPPKVTVEPVRITKETPEIKYAVQVGAEAPVGKFDGVFTQATVYDQGEPIVHYIYGAELRIDAPLVPATPVPPPPAEGEAATPVPTPKPEGPVRGDRKPAKGIAPFNR